MASQQKVQDDFYGFPYHYISSLPPRFGILRVDGWHLNYVSAMVFLLDQISQLGDRTRIVDVGCGDGRFTREIAMRFPESTVLGIDYSGRAIGLAKAMNVDVGIEFQERNLIDDPVKMENDVAVLMEVYEHIDPSNAKGFLMGVRDTLRKGGVLLLTVPHVNCPVAPHHFRHFDAKTLSTEMSELFDIQQIVPFERISRARRWLYRLSVNRYFALNHQGLLSRLFDWYMKHLFPCSSERDCQRLFVRAIRR